MIIHSLNKARRLLSDIKFRYKILYAICLCCPYLLPAQTSLGLILHGGKTVRIHPRYPKTPCFSKGIEGYISLTPSGKAPWHSLLRGPHFGFSFGIWSPGNPEVLGKMYSFMPVFGQLLAEKERWEWDYEIGASLVWFTRPYHRQTNPSNIAVGSHLSSLSFLRTRFFFTLMPSVSLMTGVGIIHSSNGGTSSPNLGVNIPECMVGIMYSVGNFSSKTQIKEYSRPPNRKNAYLWGIRIGLGMTENLAPGGPKYGVSTANIFWGKEATPWLNWRVGSEVFYSYRSKAALIEGEITTKGLNHKATGVVVYGGGEIVAGHIGLLMQAGTYLINPIQMEDYRIYTKLGIQFYPFDRQERNKRQFYTGVYVHAHSGEADFAEIGVGYLF